MTEEPALVALAAVEVETAPNLWLWPAVGAILLASCGHLLIKLGLTIGAGRPASGLLVRIGQYLAEPWVLVGLMIYATGTVLWIYAVSQRQISFLYPLTALTYAIVAVGGRLIFGEVISPGRWLGIAVVVAGVAMLQLSETGARE
jgi:drug/metabolite transporter (DMT)-like permease